MNLLIIEDDNILAEQISKIFTITWNFNNIKIINSFCSFLSEYTIINSYDIVVVDIILGSFFSYSENWIEIVKMIRKKSVNMPIIIISWLNDIEWLEKTFLLWVNDYISKPFRLRELEIRVNSCIKIFFNNNPLVKNKVYYYELSKDLINNNFYFNWNLIYLTKKSKYILSLFISKPEMLLTDNYLIEKIWWDRWYIIERNPRVNILRLKKYLEPFWINNRIYNIRGEWYMLKK